MTLSFWEYKLTTRIENRRGALCLGERIKKGTYRSTVTTIPYSQITGALRAALHLPKDQAWQIHAIGKFTKLNPVEDYLTTVTMGMRQRMSGVAQIPIDTTALVGVEGNIYLEINDVTKEWDKLYKAIIVKMGAYRNKGLGRCLLEWTRRLDVTETRRGILTTRIPENQLARFGITAPVEKPVYGYLFQPDETYTTGRYVRALFEKSIVKGPNFLLE